MALLTADWSPFGKDEFFRRFDVYDMEWFAEISLEKFKLTSSRFGGPIAAVRNKAKIVEIHGSGRPVIAIYTAAGESIESFKWNNGQLVNFGWSSASDLIFVQEDAKILVYDVGGNFQYHFSMGREAEDMKVVDAQIFTTCYGTGAAVLTQTNKIFFVNTVREREAKVRRFIEPEASVPGKPSAWVAFCQNRGVQVFYAKGKSLFLLTEGEQPMNQFQLEDEGSFITSIAISADYEYLAFLTNKGKLRMGYLNQRMSQRPLRLFDLQVTTIPDQMMWCGNDAVVISVNNTLEVVGLSDEHIQYQYDSAVFLVQEIDCVRIISLMSHEILQKVPKVVKDIFRINSSAPGSYLLEASKQYQRRSHTANEYLHLVKPNLFPAVTQCIEAAGHELKIEIQEMLMKAAQFGKTFLDDFSPESYVRMVKILPCLNAVRDKKIGIPLTFVQFESLGMSGLLDLLVARRHYYLALKIAKILKLPEETINILSQWACYKVKQNLSKDQIAKEISEKLKGTRGISYIKIAQIASEAGKTELAIKLIEYEPMASQQVPLLLKLGNSWTALQKAIDSGDTELVYMVIQHLKESPDTEFKVKIRKYPLAQSLYLKFCRQYNDEVYRHLLSLEDNGLGLAEYYIRESYDKENNGMTETALVQASENYKKAKNEVYHALCEEQLKLLKYQRGLHKKFEKDFIGKSLHDTVKMLLVLNEVKLADKLRLEYKVPDRRYWWLRVEIFGEKEDFVGLEAFSKSKKSPIGYEPFVDVCLEKSNNSEALKYLPKVKDENKVKYLVKMNKLEEAAQTAFQQNDRQALLYIQPKCDAMLSQKVTFMINQLSSK